MIRLTKEQIVHLHSQLIEKTGGVSGIRDDRMLESAINAPFQTFTGNDVYPTILEKAARLGYGIVKNHAFIDGNKRIGTHAMLVFLELNNITMSYTQEELANIILNVAASISAYEDLLNWIKQHQI